MSYLKNLSHPQKRILLTDIIHSDLEMSNVGLLVKLNIDHFDPKILEYAINYLVEKDDGTRIRLKKNNIDNSIEQYVEDYNNFEVDYKDYSNKSLEELLTYCKINHHKKFDLFDSCLFYFCIVKFSKNSGGFYLKAHHLISDGNSAVITINNIIKIYKQLLSGDEVTIEKSTSYLHYIESELKYMNSSRFNEDSKFWLSQYETVPNAISLSTKDKIKNTLETKRIYFTFDNKITEKIISYKNEMKISLFGIFLEVFSIYIYKCTSNKDFSIGIPTHNRYDKKFDNSIGMFVSSLPFRVKIDENQTIKEFHTQIKGNLWCSLKHQKYPYDLLVNELLEKTNSELNLLNFQLVEVPGFNSNDLEIIQHFSSRFSLSELSFFINLRDKLKDNILEIAIDYQYDIFDEKDINFMLKRIETLFENYVGIQDKKISEINILTKSELDILSKFNETKDNSVQNENIIMQFKKSVELFPNNIAVSDRQNSITFKELDIASTNLAYNLINGDANTSSPIAVIMNNSLETVISIIGILNAGLSYLPIDPNTPLERIEYILKDCGISTIIIFSNLKQKFEKFNEHLKIICIDTLDYLGKPNKLKKNIVIELYNTAYVIYTSGSTGNPKGVAITHENLSNYINWAKNYYKLEERYIFPLYSSISFDLTITSIFVPLVTGGQIIVYNDEDFENTFLKIFEDNLVNSVKLTPSHLKIIQNMDFKDNSIKQLIVGGEELTYNLAKKTYKNFENKINIFNEYGPTETTVGCSIYKFNPEEYFVNTLPIGKPISNSSILVLNEKMKMLPLGRIGEIYISGKGVAIGYVNKQTETNNKFIKNPFSEKERMYKSGDLGRWCYDGNLEYYGRIDNQVKIRGFRVELDEISSKIEKIEKINECIVIEENNLEKNVSLSCYYVANEHIDPNIITSYLSDKLPFYMIPNYFQQIEKIPLTINGKVDKKRLPKASLIKKKHDELKLPIDEVEKIILEVWKEVLNLDEIGVEENFFELGGDSIKAIQIVSSLRSRGIKLRVKDIFSQLNIRCCRLVAILDIINPKSNEPLKGDKKLIPIEEWFFHNDFENNNYYNQSVLIKFKVEISIHNVEKVMNRLISYHDGLRLNYNTIKHEMFYNNNFLDNNFFVNEEIIEGSDFENEISRIKRKYGKQFNITNDLLIKVIVIKSNKSEYLLLIAHHLVIDGVSWRILLEDFTNIYSNLQEHNKIYYLPPKSTSLQEWSNFLHSYAFNNKILEQVEYWNKIQNQKFELPIDSSKIDMRTANLDFGSIDITKEITEYISQNLFKNHNISVVEFLLLAVVKSLKTWLHQDEIVIDMEGHGRDNDEFDLSRTIGWFTTIYPILINLKGDDLGNQIKIIRKSLDSVPANGIGYGLLTYIHQEMLKKNKMSEVRFNYLGQFGFGNNNELFEYLADSFLFNVSEENTMTAKIEVESFIINNKLKLLIKFNKNSFNNSTINSFMKEIENNIIKIYDFLISTNEKYLSNFHFETIELDEGDFDSLFE